MTRGSSSRPPLLHPRLLLLLRLIIEVLFDCETVCQCRMRQCCFFGMFLHLPPAVVPFNPHDTLRTGSQLRLHFVDTIHVSYWSLLYFPPQYDALYITLVMSRVRMRFPSPPAVALLYRRWARQSVCRKHGLLRYMSRSLETHIKEPLHKNSTGQAPLGVTFESLGVGAPIAAALRVAFPDVQQPTTMQRKMIPAVVGKQDILLQDFTGTGKCVLVAEC